MDVYEDRLVKAFFDINPASEGHTLIIPKSIMKTSMKFLRENLIMVVAKKLALIYRNALGANAVNILHASGREA